MSDGKKTGYGDEGIVHRFGLVPPKPPVQRGPVVAKPAEPVGQKPQSVKSATKSGQK